MEQQESKIHRPLNELASLCDVYAVLQPEYRKRQTTYVLQTLWRDLTPDFDVIGPHYTNDGPFSHHSLCRLLLDSIHQFHVCGFETDAVVCDGAPANMTMVKEMSGAPRKAYRSVYPLIVASVFYTLTLLLQCCCWFRHCEAVLSLALHW